MAIRLTREEFIEKAKKIHGDKYDYSKVEYKNIVTKVCIICPIHGEFWQRPKNHVDGWGCKMCGSKKKTTEEWINEAKMVHGNKYDYSKSEYTTNKGKVCIICPTHGNFWQRADHHLNGCVCPKCKWDLLSEKLSLGKDEFVSRAIKVHGNKYDYSNVDYINNCVKVCIVCPEHGVFWQSPDKHLFGDGCPKCVSTHLQNEIRTLLQLNNVDFTEEQRFEWLKYKHTLPLDFYLTDYNVAIECQGIQHFIPVEFFGGENGFQDRVRRDTLKRQLCQEHGIRLLYYSNLGIDYPYDVIESKEQLLQEIKRQSNG